jgi:hypothetical protein
LLGREEKVDMRERGIGLLLVALAVVSCIPLHTWAIDEIPVTRWAGPEGTRPTTYEEWLSYQPAPTPAHVEKAYQTVGQGRGVRFDIVVNDNLYEDIVAPLTAYIADVELEGHMVTIYEWSGGTPSDLRGFMRIEYSVGTEGFLLIGDLPTPWYELDYWGYEEFPIDFYYMDLDGTFGDSDHDGLYDSHTGEVLPEVWTARLTASPLVMGGKDEVDHLFNYFRKNHEHRRGDINLDRRALVYVDDDWEPWADEWSGDVGLAYQTRTLVKDPYETTHWDYEARLDDNYEWVLVCAHSWPGGHYFYEGSGGGYTYVSEVVAIDPVALGYNLFACSNARYTEEDYMGGWYIFCDTYGLDAVGSTKTGAMLEFDEFYRPMGCGRNVGESFRDWFEAIGEDGYSDYEKAWHYGMTLLGDPTLVYAEPVSIELIPESVIVKRGGKLCFDATLTNEVDTTQVWDVWTEAILPNGSVKAVEPPRTFTLSGGQSISAHICHKVPGGAPLGDYTYCAKVGMYPADVVAMDCFDFTVVP